MRKTFSLMLLALLLVGCTQNKPEPLGNHLKTLSKENEQLITNIVPNNSTINTDDWLTYRNTKYGFEFKYPHIFEVVEKNGRFMNVIYN